jgi:hypothetical protein
MVDLINSVNYITIREKELAYEILEAWNRVCEGKPQAGKGVRYWGDLYTDELSKFSFPDDYANCYNAVGELTNYGKACREMVESVAIESPSHGQLANVPNPVDAYGEWTPRRIADRDGD